MVIYSFLQGASLARGEVLIFCHADTRLPQGYDDIIRTALEEPDVLMTGDEITKLTNALIILICYVCNFGLLHSQLVCGSRLV